MTAAREEEVVEPTGRAPRCMLVLINHAEQLSGAVFDIRIYRCIALYILGSHRSHV